MSSTIDDSKYMRRAFELAEKGLGNVAPNPLVGCVIVNDGTIIGEGWHERYGHEHAEVNAVQSIANEHNLEGATVFVNLEPCSHYGNTGPCALMLSKLPIARVVISNIDPNPQVSGKGIKLLREKGIQVDCNILSAEGANLNRRFFTFHNLKRPYVILKWAQTEDSFIARENNDSKWISNKYARKLVHKWRSEEAAIMVGTNTVFHDNPKLTVRNWTGSNPIRVIVDSNLRLSNDLHVFDKSVPTLILNNIKEANSENLTYIKLNNTYDPTEIIKVLHALSIQSLFIEGGSKLLQRFISADLWDEARVFIGDLKFTNGIKAPVLQKDYGCRETLFGNTMLTYKNQNE